MSELATVTPILDRVSTRRKNRVIVSPSALEVARNHVREQKEIAVIAEEREFVAGWRDEENQIMAALAGHGLRRITKIE